MHRVWCGHLIQGEVRLKCGASQTKAAPASINCISCDAEIPDFAKFCEECGAAQNREAAAIQEDESALYRKAADQGDVDAQFNLGVMYENGQGGLAKDDAQAVTWYQKAAEQGDAKAQANINRLKQDRENADKQKQVSILTLCPQTTKTLLLAASRLVS